MSEQNPWQCLTVVDLEPVEAPPFVLQAGLTPTWARWREGRYAERQKVFASLWKAFGEWRTGLVELGSNLGRYLPVFWIEGRPGDGKSTLLLQLMAACLSEQMAPAVFWLEHSPDGRSFRAKPPAQAGLRFCAEVPGRAEGQVRDSWLAALRESGTSTLITAGSAEARRGFEFRFESQTKVTKWVLPPFSPAETAGFAQWCQSRVGISADPAALWRDGMSLAEFLLALWHGKPLVELMSDVRGALGHLGLGGQVRAVWLVNSLGLRAPGTLLETEAGRDHAAKLAERGLVPVETDAAGLRLAPPTVAWPLVGTWLGQGHERHHLVEALAFALKAWLEAGDEENAVRFLRQLRETEWLMDDKPFGHGNPFVQVKRTEVIRELYRLHRRDFGERPAPATIPAWLELNEGFSLMLLPDPVVCATELFSKPEGEAHRTSPLAALLWLAADNRRPPVGDSARKAVADYFLAPADGPSAGRALMRMVRDTKKAAEARALAEAWLKRLPGHPEAVDALGALVKRAGGTDEFMAWAAEHFLQPKPSLPGAPKLLAAMLEGRLHDETLRRRAAAWAWSHALEPDTGLVWHTLLSSKLAKEDVLRGAFRWLAAHPQHRQAGALRERFLEHYPEAPGAGWVMQEWLPDHAAAEAAPDLLLKLLATQPNSREASAAALKWLNQSLTHPATPKLLRVLVKHPDPALEAAAERWFDANPDSASHAELLSVFIHALRGDARWMARGEIYAGEAQRHGREHVTAALLVAGECRLRDVRLALGLLPELAVGPRTFLETALGRALARHPRQAEQAFRQLAGSPQVSDLARALPRGLAQMADTREAFVQRVLPAMDEEARRQTLYRLVRADVRSAEIVSVLLAWLRDHHRQRGYTPLLGALHNHPAVWNCLLATGRLDRRVVTDHRNYRSQPGERIGETDPPA